MRSLLLLLLASSIACADAPSAPVLSVRVITTDGRNPFDLGDFETFTASVSQEDVPGIESMTAVDGTFDVGLVIDSLNVETRIRMRLEGDSPLHGAPPRFIPAATRGFVRIPIGPPEVCETVPGFDLTSRAGDLPREGAGVARIDTFVIVLGGEGTARVDILDLLELGIVSSETSPSLETIPTPGPVVAAHLAETRALVISDREAFTYDLGVGSDRISSLRLHMGSSSQSTLLERPGGVFVAGPGEGFSLVALDGTVLTGSLVVPRTQPALYEIGGRIVVIGGNDSGPLIEVVDPDRATSEALDIEGTSAAPRVLRAGDALWLLGDADAQPSQVLRGCPVCRPEEGPVVMEEGTTHGLLLIGDAVWRATDELVLERVAVLEESRRGAFAFPYESGMVLTGLGSDAEGPRGDVELCFPPTLEPL